MDKSVVSDLLVSFEDADLALRKRIDALEKCGDSYPELHEWYDKTIEVLDGAFATGATKYFSDNSGFVFAYVLNQGKQLRRANKSRAFGILKRMREGLAKVNDPPENAPVSSKAAVGPVSGSKRVFIVHGHDEVLREKVARTLEKLGLTPVILHEQANRGATIIEKFERNSDVGFAVILMTPDDVGGKDADQKNLQPRARQNVVLELGYFCGKLGREGVCVLHSVGLETPSDIHGIVYTPIDDRDHWKFDLVKELRAAGYQVSADAIT